MSKLFYFIILSLHFYISSLQDDKNTHKTHESKSNDILRPSDIPPKSKLNLSTWSPFKILQKASFGRKSSGEGCKIIIDSDTIHEVNDESIKEVNKLPFTIKVEKSEPEEINSSDGEEIFIKEGISGCSVLASGTDYTQCERYGLDIKKWRALLLESFSSALKEPERIQSFHQNIESLEELELYERRSSMTDCIAVNLNMDHHVENENFVILQPVETPSKKKSESEILSISVDPASKLNASMGQMKDREIDTQPHGSSSTVTSKEVSIDCKTTNEDIGAYNPCLMVQGRDHLHKLLVEESKDKIIQIVVDDCDGNVFADNSNNDNVRVPPSFEQIQSYSVKETAMDFENQKYKSLEHFNLEKPRHAIIQVKSAEQVFAENTSSDQVDNGLTAEQLNIYNLKETNITSEIDQCELLHNELEEQPVVEANEIAQCITSDFCFDDSSSNSINISGRISCILNKNYVMQEQQIKGNQNQCDHKLFIDEPKDDVTEIVEEGTQKKMLSSRYGQVSFSMDQLDSYSLTESGIALSFDSRMAIEGLTGDLDQDEVTQLCVITMPADNYNNHGSSHSKDSIIVDSFSAAKKESETNKEEPKATILTLEHLLCNEVEIKAINYMPSSSSEVKRGSVDTSLEFHSDIRKTAADYAKNKYSADSMDNKNKMTTVDCKIQTAQAVSCNETAISCAILQKDMIPESNPAVEEVLQYPKGFHKRIGNTNVITPSTEVDDCTEKAFLPANVMPVSKQNMNISRVESSSEVHSIISDAKETMKVISLPDKNSFQECNPALEEELQHSKDFQKRICSTEVTTHPTEADDLTGKVLLPANVTPVSKQTMNIESSSEVHSIISGDVTETKEVTSSRDDDSFGPSEASHLFVLNGYISEPTTFKEENLGYSNTTTGMTTNVAKVRFPLREKDKDLSSKWYVDFDAMLKHNQNMSDPFVGSEVSLSLDQLDSYSLKESGIALSFDSRMAIEGLTGDLDQDEVAQLCIMTMPANNYNNHGSSHSKDLIIVDSYSAAKKESETNKEEPKAAILTLEHLLCNEVEIKATNYMPSSSSEVKRGSVDTSLEFHSDIRKTAADYAKNKYSAKSMDNKNKMTTVDCKIQTAQAVSYNETAISCAILQKDMIPESNPAVEEVLQYPKGFHKRIGSTNVITPPTEVDDCTEKAFLPANVMPVSKQNMNISRVESSSEVHSIISDAKETMRVISLLGKNSFRECNPALEEELQHSKDFQKRICSTEVTTHPTEADDLTGKVLLPANVTPISKQTMNIESSSEVHSIISGDVTETKEVTSSRDDDSFGPSEASHLFVLNGYVSEPTTFKEENLGYSNTTTGTTTNVSKVRFPLREKDKDLSSKWYADFDAMLEYNQNMSDPFVGSESEDAFGNESNKNSQKRHSLVVTGISTSVNTDKRVDASNITTSGDLGGTKIPNPKGNELKIIPDSNVNLPIVVNADCLEPSNGKDLPHSTVFEGDNFITRITCEGKFEQPYDAYFKKDACNTMFLPSEIDVGNYDSFTEQEFSSFNFNKNREETKDVSNSLAGTEWETGTKEMKGEDKFQTSETAVSKLESNDARINTPTAHVPVTEEQDTKVTVSGVHDAYFKRECSEEVDTFAVKRFERDDQAQFKESRSSRAWSKTSMEIQDKENSNVRPGQNMGAAFMSEKIIITKLLPCSAHRKPGSKSVPKEECQCSILEYITLPNNFSLTDYCNILEGNFQRIRVNSRYSNSQSKEREREKTYTEDLECLGTSNSANITAKPLPPPPKFRKLSNLLKAECMSEKIIITKLLQCSAHRKHGSKSVSKEECQCSILEYITLPNEFSSTDVENIKQGNFQRVRVNSRYSNSQSKKRERKITFAEDLECLRTSKSGNIIAESLSLPAKFKTLSPMLKANKSATNVDNAEDQNNDSDSEEICTCTSQQSTSSMQLRHSVVERNVMQECCSFYTREEYAGPSVDHSTTEAEAESDDSYCEEICTCTRQQSNLSMDAESSVTATSTSLKANNSATSVDNAEAQNDDSDNEEICTCTSQQSTSSIQLQHSVAERNVIQEYRSFYTGEEYAGPSVDNSATDAEAGSDDSYCEEICTCTNQQSNLSMNVDSSVAATSTSLKTNNRTTSIDNAEAKNDDSDSEEICTCTSQQSTSSIQLQHSVAERNVIQEYRSFYTREEYAGPSVDNRANDAETKSDDSYCKETCTCTNQERNLSMDAESSVAASPKIKGRLRKLKRFFKKKKARNNTECKEET